MLIEIRDCLLNAPSATILLAAVTMTGCASMLGPELDADHPLTEANQVMVQLRRDSDRARQDASIGNDPGWRLIAKGASAIVGSSDHTPKPVAPPRPRVTTGEGYRVLELGVVQGTQAFWDAGLRSACGSRQGNFVGGQFCVSTQNPDEVRFFVLRTQTSLKWIEPTSSPTASGYWNMVRLAGFVTRAEHADRTRASQARAAELLAAEQRRLQYEWPRMQEIGVKVCKQEGMVRYTAFVEAFSDSRFQLRVVDAIVVNTPYRPTDFRPQIIWSEPTSWTRC